MLREFAIMSIITLIQEHASTLQQLIVRQEFGSDVAHCLLDILSTYFPEDAPIAIQLPNMVYCNAKKWISQNEDDFLATFGNGTVHQQVDFGCYLDGISQTESYLIKPAVAVILLPNVSLKLQVYHLDASITQINILFGNYGVPIIVVSTHLFSDRTDQISAVLELLNTAWKLLFLDDIIMLYPEITETSKSEPRISIDVFSWLPEKQHDVCLHDLNKVSLIDTWITSERRFLKKSNLFLKKNTFSKNCKLDVGLYQNPPYVFINTDKTPSVLVNESDFRGVFKEMFDAMKQYHSLRFSFYSAIKLDRKYDITVPLYLGNNSHACRTTYPYFMLTVTWYVPAFPIPRWQGLFRIFSLVPMTVVVVVYVLGSLVFLSVERRESRREKNVARVFIDTLCTHLGMGIRYNYEGIIPTGFMTIWLLYCILVYTYFQSELIGFLVNPGYFPQMKSLSELENSGFEKLTSIFFSGEYYSLPYENCTLWNCLVKLSEPNDLAVLAPIYAFDPIIRNSFRKSGKLQIVKVIESLRTYHFSVWTTRGCTFAHKINDVVERMITSGLANKWMDSLKEQQWDIKNQFNVSNEYSNGISLSNLHTTFYLLVTGLFLSLAVFFVEIVYNLVKNR